MGEEDKALLKLPLQQMSAHLPVLVTQVLHLNAALLPAHETLMQSTQGASQLSFFTLCDFQHILRHHYLLN